MTVTLPEILLTPGAWPWWVWPLIVYGCTTVLIRVTGGRHSFVMACEPDRRRRGNDFSLAHAILIAWIFAPLVLAILLGMCVVWVVTLGVVPPLWKQGTEYLD